MEDSHIAELDMGNGVHFFGVYDGHGGKRITPLKFAYLRTYIGNEVADFVRDHLADELRKMASFKSGDY
jgi:serine/threonine protein phosphatase PrpC